MKKKPEDYWKEKFTSKQHHVARVKRYEAAFTDEYVDINITGCYRCVAYVQKQFSSDTVFDSHSGWPSFTDRINPKHVESQTDISLDMSRAEVTCVNSASFAIKPKR